MDKKTRSYKNKVYTFKYRTMNSMVSPEWLKRGYAFVGQTQEHLKDILKELRRVEPNRLPCLREVSRNPSKESKA